MPLKTIAELQKEIDRQRRQVDKLVARRAKLQSRVAGLDRQIAAIAGSADVSVSGVSVPRLAAAPRAIVQAVTGLVAPAKRGRRRSEQSLGAFIVGVLGKADEPMRARDIKDAVVKAGYKTTSKTFYNIVATTLREDGRFKKVGRGLYKLAK